MLSSAMASYVVSICIWGFIPSCVRKLIVHGLTYSILGITIYGHCSLTWYAEVGKTLGAILRRNVNNDRNVPSDAIFCNYL